MDTELVTIREAARYLGVSRVSVYRLIQAGALTVYRPLPDAPRLRRSELDAYIEAVRVRR